MAIDYEYQAHENKLERAKRGPATRAKVTEKSRTSSSAIQRINARIGLQITNGVGTMWAAYAFALLALVSLPAAIASKDILIMVSWGAQTFLQLVLLPIIIVGQNIQAKAADARAIATYEDADAILHDAQQIQKHLDAQDKAIERLLAQVEKLENKLLETQNKKQK